MVCGGTRGVTYYSGWNGAYNDERRRVIPALLAFDGNFWCALGRNSHICRQPYLKRAFWFFYWATPSIPQFIPKRRIIPQTQLPVTGWRFFSAFPTVVHSPCCVVLCSQQYMCPNSMAPKTNYPRETGLFWRDSHRVMASSPKPSH